MSLKHKISSPLEAGPSVLDAQHLPPQLVPALEYSSSRLARKSLHLTLLVARRDYQLPPSPVLSPPGLGWGSASSSSSPVTPPSSSSSPLPSPLHSSRRFTRHLARWTRHTTFSSPPPSVASSSMPNSPRSIISSSPAYTPMSLEFPRNQPTLPLSPRSPMWPLTPIAPYSPSPHMTPSAATSSIPTESAYQRGFPMASQHGIRLIHHENLPRKAEKALQSALAKANRKCHLETDIAPALGATACGLTSALFNNSVAQNEVLFSSDGLSLISFDRLYSLKAALSSYCKTGSPLRLEDAVDELRRYVLMSGKKISKADLLRSYDWLNVSNSALADLDRMYRLAYGGPKNVGAIDGMSFAPIFESSVWSDDDEDEVDEDDVDDDDDDDDDNQGNGDDNSGDNDQVDNQVNNNQVDDAAFNDQDSGVYVEALPDSPTVGVDTPGPSYLATGSTTPLPILRKHSPSPELPSLLRVNTAFEKKNTPSASSHDQAADKEATMDVAGTRGQEQDDNAAHQEEEEEGACDEKSERRVGRTASRQDRGDEAPEARNSLWRNSGPPPSIGQVLGPDPLLLPPQEADDGKGPMTPNGYDDISPITRGEWGFLLVDRGFRSARTVAVETC